MKNHTKSLLHISRSILTASFLKGQVMLTKLESILRPRRPQQNWNAPDHWNHHHARRTRAQMEKEAELRRHRLYRDAWMW
ncbi:hypothetical protein [Yoonia sp. 2307UL14-13]|uniref:hypothetical protein n=1 Tax=Yoonia sp. 2307UL14-13 TaxID=3126506 RepID=UPI0030B5EE1A